MVIVFQGTQEGKHGTAAAMVTAAAFQMARSNKKIAIMSFCDNEKKNNIENFAFTAENMPDIGNPLMELGDFEFNDTGIDALIRRSETGVLSKEHFSTCCMPAIKMTHGLDVIGTTNSEEFENDIAARFDVAKGVINMANEIYNFVFVLADSQHKDLTEKLDIVADKVVVIVRQAKADAELGFSPEIAEKVSLLVADYEDESAYSVRYLKKGYKVKKLYVMPHSVAYRDASTNGSLVRFALRNASLDETKGDINYGFSSSMKLLLDNICGKIDDDGEATDTDEAEGEEINPKEVKKVKEKKQTGEIEPDVTKKVTISKKPKGLFKKKEVFDRVVVGESTLEADEELVSSEEEPSCEDIDKHEDRRRKQKRGKSKEADFSENVDLQEDAKDSVLVNPDATENPSDESCTDEPDSSIVKTQENAPSGSKTEALLFNEQEAAENKEYNSSPKAENEPAREETRALLNKRRRFFEASDDSGEARERQNVFIPVNEEAVKETEDFAEDTNPVEELQEKNGAADHQDTSASVTANTEEQNREVMQESDEKAEEIAKKPSSIHRDEIPADEFEEALAPVKDKKKKGLLSFFNKSKAVVRTANFGSVKEPPVDVVENEICEALKAAGFQAAELAKPASDNDLEAPIEYLDDDQLTEDEEPYFDDGDFFADEEGAADHLVKSVSKGTAQDTAPRDQEHAGLTTFTEVVSENARGTKEPEPTMNTAEDLKEEEVEALF